MLVGGYADLFILNPQIRHEQHTLSNFSPLLCFNPGCAIGKNKGYRTSYTTPLITACAAATMIGYDNYIEELALRDD